jgi:hypothetical protein
VNASFTFSSDFHLQARWRDKIYWQFTFQILTRNNGNRRGSLSAPCARVVYTTETAKIQPGNLFGAIPEAGEVSFFTTKSTENTDVGREEGGRIGRHQPSSDPSL